MGLFSDGDFYDNPAFEVPGGSGRLDCHFTGIPSPSLLEHTLKREGGVQQNDSLADG